MPGFIGLPEILLLGLVALLLFGPKRLPEMGRGLGKGLREFKDSVSGDDKHTPAELTMSTDLSAYDVSEADRQQKVA
jgi:sec-independent protein translocase protein TatA